MKLIIDIPDEAYELLKSKSELDNIAESIIANGTPYEPKGDLISREALKKAIEPYRYATDGVFEGILLIIDNAPTISPFKPMCKAKDEAICEEMTTDGHCNYSKPCPNKGEDRPQGEYVDISKLRLMTVEECAGHTIEYAMGWKACVEWIKKGGKK